MATEKEEIILDFKVESGDMIAELEKLKLLIRDNKQAQIDLNKAFKAGAISEKEFIAESVRVENTLKRQQKQYNDTQKAVLGHKSKIDELIKSNDKLSKTNQNLSNSFKEAAGNINIAGTNVGTLGTKIASLANPVTAAVAGIGALSKLYASSTIGAKDLEFAQNRLTAAFNLTSNAFASLISSGEDGQGIFSLFVDAVLDRFVPAVSVLSEILAKNIEELEDLGRKELEVREEINDVLGENQELMTQLQDDQLSYNDKIGLTNRIITNIRDNEEKLKSVLQDELTLLEFRLKLDRQNEGLQTSVLQKRLEISRVGKDADNKAEAIRRTEVNLLDIENKRLAALREMDEINRRLAGSPRNEEDILKQRNQNRFGVTAGDSDILARNAGSQELERQATFEKAKVALTEQGLERRIEAERLYTDFIEAEQMARLNATAGFFGALSSLFKQGSEEQKGLALFQIAIDSAVGVSGAIKAGAGVPFPGNLVAILTGVTAVLSGIGQARQLLGFKSGGYTGDGNPHDVAGVVHRKEVVWNAQDVAAMGGPNVVNAMRPTAGRRSSRGSGYYDGGIVANNATKEVDTSLATINAIKNIPPPIVSAVEVTKAQRRVRVKEQISNR